MIEFVQRPGETVWVPGYWWHAVLNLDDTVAITQNVCTTAGFPRVWAEAIRNRRGMARKWIRVLSLERPLLAAAATEFNKREGISLALQAKHHRQRKLEQSIRRAKRLARKDCRSPSAAKTSTASTSSDSSSDSSSTSGSSSSGSCTSSSDSASPKCSEKMSATKKLAKQAEEWGADATRATRACGATAASGHPATDDDEPEIEVSFSAYSAQRRKKVRVASPLKHLPSGDVTTTDGALRAGESKRKHKSR
jgi:hypothetical protein